MRDEVLGSYSSLFLPQRPRSFDRRGAEISAALTEAGLEDIAAHFLPD